MYVIVIYSLFFLLALISLTDNKLSDFINKHSRKILLIIFVFFGFRLSIGPDFGPYRDMFAMATGEFNELIMNSPSRNILFNVLLNLVKLFTDDFGHFMLVFNIICLSIMYYVIKDSDNIMLSIMIFIGCGVLEVYYGSGMRQMLAMVIFFLAYFKYLKNNKYIRYYLLMLIAFLFHDIAIIAMVLPIIKKIYDVMIKKMNNKRMLSLFCLLLVLSIIISVLFNTLWPVFVEVLPNTIVYYLYESEFSLVGLLLRIVMFLFVSILACLTNKNKLNDFERFSIIVCFFSFCVYIILCNYSIMARVSDFLAIIEIMLIPSLLMKIDNNQLKYLFVVVCFSINLVLLYSDITFKINYRYSSNDIMEYPYVNVFDFDKTVEYYE